MKLHGVLIENTFAEAFDMVATRLIVTAASHAWAEHAVQAMTGFATSVIGCGVEAGKESHLSPSETPDGRPGISALFFAVSKKELEKQVSRRIGQCVLTCPSTSVFAGMEGVDRIGLGKIIRYFGDGFQISKVIGEERYWRIPVMDGEFVCQDTVPVVRAIGGGNLLLFVQDQMQALELCDLAVAEIRTVPGVIAPFPGGVTRSGSKVGSKYKMLRASTNEAYCPTLVDLVATRIMEGARVTLEIVIDGLTSEVIVEAKKRAMAVLIREGKRLGLLGISAGNYGGNLGKHHFHLRDILADSVSEMDP